MHSGQLRYHVSILVTVIYVGAHGYNYFDTKSHELGPAPSANRC